MTLPHCHFSDPGGDFNPDCIDCVEAMQKDYNRLRSLIKMGEAVVEDFMPNIGHCVLQDYGRLNKFLGEASKIKEPS